MENTPPKSEQFAPCNIDIKRPDKTHISAWRDKAEFQSVYDQIFQSPADDVASKEAGVKWLNVWKIRQNRDIPICIRCTLVVLEAQLFDLRSRREGRDSTVEIKSIYAGAFTRFINFVTEETQDYRYKKISIAEHVRGIGIETYLVELRHLCSHRSVSVSIDVFRRSAQYCMDWLQASYWERELATMQPVVLCAVKAERLSAKLPELTTILRTYDAATAGLALHATTVTQVEASLKPDELALLQVFHASRKLRVIAAQQVRDLREKLSLPRNAVGVRAVCDGLFNDCRHLFEDTLRKNGGPTDSKPAPLGAIHSELFRHLASAGYLQAFFERLVAACENESESADRRQAASHWALKIAVGFQLLRQFKRECKSLPPARVVRFHASTREETDLALEVAKQWYERTLRGGEAGQQLMLGTTVDCPWQLKVSRPYLQNRLAAVSPYTKEIVPVLLTLVQPSMKLSQQKKIEQLMRIYLGEGSSGTAIGDQNKPLPKADGGDEAKRIYTKDDLAEAVGTKRPAEEDDQPEGKRSVKRWGPWSEPTEGVIDWECCPLGTNHVSVKC